MTVMDAKKTKKKKKKVRRVLLSVGYRTEAYIVFGVFLEISGFQYIYVVMDPPCTPYSTPV